MLHLCDNIAHGYRIYFFTRHCEPREAIQSPATSSNLAFYEGLDG
jgi:hypothetical protein